jgi:hypothetical protein
VAANTPLMRSEYIEQLDSIAEDGLLPPWSEWFGPGVMASLIPNARTRELIESELPRVPIDYLSGLVPPVDIWPAVHNGYVLLSDGYVADAEEAQRRGWPVVELLGSHLDVVAKPFEVAAAIIQASSSN